MPGLDPTAFARWMAVLGDRFGRPLGEVTKRLYFETLDAHLTTDEFERAARACFDHETFWPAPMKLIGKVQADANARAIDAWTELMDAIRENRRANLDGTALAALRDAGGRNAIERCDIDKDLPHYRRAFLAAFKDRADTAPAALPGSRPAIGRGGDA